MREHLTGPRLGPSRKVRTVSTNVPIPAAQRPDASPAASGFVVVELDQSPGGGGTVVAELTTRQAADELADELASSPRARARRLDYEVAAVHDAAVTS